MIFSTSCSEVVFIFPEHPLCFNSVLSHFVTSLLHGKKCHHNYDATKAKKKKKMHKQVALLKNIYPQYLSIAAEKARKENKGIVIVKRTSFFLTIS